MEQAIRHKVSVLHLEKLAQKTEKVYEAALIGKAL
jgi:hypothetical protein